MPSKLYIKLQSTLTLIQSNLSRYLRQTGYTACTEEELLAFDKWHTQKAPRYPHPIEAGKFIHIGVSVGVSDLRNSELTLNRISNVLIISNQLHNLLKASAPEPNEADLKEALSHIKNTLQEGLRNNHQLSAYYAKTHRSSNQNNALGMNFFASWWNKTWFQSRATVAFEKSIDQINQYVPTNPITTSPSASYIKLQSLMEAMQNNLSHYLQQTGYERAYTEEELLAFDKRHTQKAPRFPHPIEAGKFIHIGVSIGVSDLRNSQLTRERISNVLIALDQLSTLLSKVPFSLLEKDLENEHSKIEKILQTGLDQNRQLSIEHHKNHHSFHFNKLAIGMGFFASWWNKTWFQSRASTVFEKSLEQLEINKTAISQVPTKVS